MKWAKRFCRYKGAKSFITFRFMWIKVVLCFVCQYLSDFFLWFKFRYTHSLDALYYVVVDLANDIVGVRQHFGDVVRSDPMKGCNCCIVRPGCVVRKEQ